jgi:hypothetical protein
MTRLLVMFAVVGLFAVSCTNACAPTSNEDTTKAAGKIKPEGGHIMLDVTATRSEVYTLTGAPGDENDLIYSFPARAGPGQKV